MAIVVEPQTTSCLLTKTFHQVKHPERAKSEAGELKSKLENYLKRAKEAKEGKKK